MADLKARWFSLFDTFADERDLDRVREQMSSTLLDLQDEWGMTATMLAVAMGWPEALAVLLQTAPDLNLHLFRTGDTALHIAVQDGKPELIEALLEAGANADLGDHFGVTARALATQRGLVDLFAKVKEREPVRPFPRIQNAEHLADHYHPRFKIPDRREREQLDVGQAVILYVFGPNRDAVTIKVRILQRTGTGEAVRFQGRLDPPDQPHNLAPGGETVTFGPEHVASVCIRKG